MKNLLDINAYAQVALRKRLELRPVRLKYRLPERPRRALGLIKIDGEVFRNDKISRATFMRISLPVWATILFSCLCAPGQNFRCRV